MKKLPKYVDGRRAVWFRKPRGHNWQVRDGEVEMFVLAGGFHNGPSCTRCGYSFCHHCQNLPSKSCIRRASRKEKR